MSDHLSTLDFDELAVGSGRDAAGTHARDCVRCGARLEQVKADRAVIMADPRFGAIRSRLSVSERGRSGFWWVAGLAACFVCVFFVLPRAATLRAKGGGPSLTLSSGAAPRIGDLIELRANPGPHPFALLLTIEGSPPAGAVLWPIGGVRSGEVPKGGSVSLQVRVTPGRFRLLGAFSDVPIGVSEALGAPSAGVELRTLEVNPAP